VISPLFQVTVDSEVYANILLSLKAMAEKADGCSDFTRVLLWTQLFSLVGCTLSNSKRFSQIIRVWTVEDAVNVLAIELLYVSFLLVQIMHPSALSLEKDGYTARDLKDCMWKAAQVTHSKEESKVKGETNTINTDKTSPSNHVPQLAAKVGKAEVNMLPQQSNEIHATDADLSNSNPNYLSLHSRFMLLQSWGAMLDEVLDVISKENIWWQLKSLSGSNTAPPSSMTFKQVMSGWNRNLNSYAGHVSIMFQIVHGEALDNKRLRELLCFPHTQIPVFSGSDPKLPPDNETESAPTSRSHEINTTSTVMNIKYILS